MNSKITEIKRKLKELEIEKKHLLQELKILEKQNKTNVIVAENNKNISGSKQLTPIEKIKIFRSLFSGRNDVFARKWTNKDGKTGYSPVKITMVNTQN